LVVTQLHPLPVVRQPCKNIPGGNVRAKLLTLPVMLLLAACAGRDPIVSVSETVPSGNWRIERQTDRITGAPLASAILTAPSSHSGEAFAKRVMLQLTCFNKAPLVRFSFEVKTGTTRNAVLGYRFDERPGHEVAARFLNDDKVAVIEDGAEVTQFVAELATAKQLYLRIRSLSFGRSSAEFNVEGGPGGGGGTTAPCPAGTKPPPPKKKSRR
jgi:hypothetical protein